MNRFGRGFAQKSKDLTDDQIWHAVGALMRARTDAELWPVIKKHPELFSYKADKLLRQRIAKAREQGKVDIVLLLIERREFLYRCQRIGIEAALVERGTGTQALSPMWRTLSGFLRIRSSSFRLWTFIKKHPELLSHEADKLLEQRIAGAHKQGSEEIEQLLIERREFLRRCRKIGVEAAIAELEGQSSSGPLWRTFDSFLRVCSNFKLWNFVKKYFKPSTDKTDEALAQPIINDLAFNQRERVNSENTSIRNGDSKLQLRSPILHKMPDPHIKFSERIKHVRWRFVAVALGSGLLAALLFSVYFQIWAKDGPGRILYQFHDEKYLWLKGNIHFYLFPYILILWGWILSIVALTLTSWLSDTSFIRGYHIRLVRKALRRHTPSHFFALFRFKPHLVWAVANNEHENALIELGQQQPGKAPEELCCRLSRLTGFIIKLEIHFHPNSTVSVSTVEKWYQAYFLLHAYGDNDAEWFQACLSDMHTAFDTLKLVTGAKTDFTKKNYFHLNKLTGELKEIVEIIKSYNERGRLDFNRLNLIVEAIDTRREILDQIYIHLQMKLTESPLLQIKEYANDKLVADLSPEEAASTGRIAQDIALHMALIREKPVIAQAYLDTCDSIFLLTEAFHLDATTYRNPTYQLYAYLAGHASSPVTDLYPLLHTANVYRFTAQLGKEDLTDKEEAWKTWFRPFRQ